MSEQAKSSQRLFFDLYHILTLRSLLQIDNVLSTYTTTIKQESK